MRDGKGRSRGGSWNPSRVLPLLPATPVVHSVSGALGGATNHGLSPAVGFSFLFSLFPGVFFGMMWQRLQNKVLPALSLLRWWTRGVMCSTDLLGFSRFSCSLLWFQAVSFDLWLSSLAIVTVVMCQSFGDLARWFPVCVTQQALLRQGFPNSGDGEAKTAAPLRLALVYVIIVARWAQYLFVVFLTFWVICAADDY
jgi:hypothetical protein